jgi:hypothetical protein
MRIRVRIRMCRFRRLSNRLCINVEKIGEKTATGYSFSLYVIDGNEKTFFDVFFAIYFNLLRGHLQAIWIYK